MKLSQLILSFFLFASASSAMEVVRGPYVDAPTQESALIRWRLDVSTVAWVEYGPSPDCSRITTICKNAREHAIRLYDLMPDTSFCYRILLPYDNGTKTVLVSTGAFRTLRPPESGEVHFIKFGDTAVPGSGNQLKMAELLDKFDPDFYINTGDLVEDGTETSADAQYFKPYRKILAKAPVFIGLGNHDYGKIALAKEGKEFMRRNYLPFHQMPWGPGTPYYYSFESGQAAFFVLDANETSDIGAAPDFSAESNQIKWLKETLSKTKALWKFVFIHQPVYSSGLHGSTKGLAELLGPIFEENGVDIVFQGHDHDYERSAPLVKGVRNEEVGVLYITAGVSGQPLYAQKTTNEWSEKFMSVYNFAAVDIKDGNMNLTVYDIDGNVIDSLEISK